MLTMNTPKLTRRPRPTQSGLTLIEVLVTVVILAVGLLGMAAMQLSGIRGANGANYRTQATIYANDLAERMRANPDGLYTDHAFLNVDTSAINCAAAPATYCSAYYDGSNQVAPANCTTAQMATFDLNVWYCGEVNSGIRIGGLNTTLPEGDATIVCNDVNPPSGDDGDACTFSSPHTIRVSWTEPNPQRNGPATIDQSVAIVITPGL